MERAKTSKDQKVTIQGSDYKKSIELVISDQFMCQVDFTIPGNTNLYCNDRVVIGCRKFDMGIGKAPILIFGMQWNPSNGPLKPGNHILPIRLSASKKIAGKDAQ